MKLLNVYARLLGPDQTPQANVLVQIEQFDLTRAAWTLLGEKKTTRAGNLTLTLELAQSSHAPWLRLTVPTPNSSQAARPLAHQAYVSFNAKTATLLADFGELHLLDGDLPMLSPTQKQFTRAAEATLALGDRQWLNQRIATAAANTPLTSTINTRAVERAQSATIPHQTLSRTAATLDATEAGATPSNTIVAREITDSKATPASEAIELGAGAAALDAFTAELIRFRARESQLATDLQHTQLQLGASEQTLKAAQQLADTRAHELLKLEARTQALADENTRLIAESKQATPISHLADNIGHQIEAANAALARDAQPYRIQNVQLELRGNLLDAGNSISLSHPRDSAAQQSASAVVRMDLAAQSVSAPRTAVTLPDLTGLTQTAVERLLNALGLKLKALAQPLRLGEAAGIGQALRQAPPAQTGVAPHSTVTVVFASAAKEYL